MTATVVARHRPLVSLSLYRASEPHLGHVLALRRIGSGLFVASADAVCVSTSDAP